MKANTYKLSEAADSDLERIFDYTNNTFGFEQAVFYLSEIEKLFILLGQNPLIGRERSEIRETLRSIRFESHTIFYRVLENHIWIVRVLHSSKDLDSFSE